MRSVRNRSSQPMISGLEGRLLVSGTAVPLEAHAHPAVLAALTYAGATPDTLAVAKARTTATARLTTITDVVQTNDSEGNGSVLKKPHFHAEDARPTLAQLNAIAAAGDHGKRDFILTAKNKRAININTRATHVLVIDHNGKLGAGPIPGPPSSRLNTTPAIKRVPGHTPTVTVTHLASKKSTTLQNPTRAIANHGKELQVVIPLPATSLGPSHHRYPCRPDNVQSGSTTIARSGPEFQDIHVG